VSFLCAVGCGLCVSGGAYGWAAFFALASIGAELGEIRKAIRGEL
jgi:hypothetical protein